MDESFRIYPIGAVVRPSDAAEPCDDSLKASAARLDDEDETTAAAEPRDTRAASTASEQRNDRDRAPGEVHVREEYRAGLLELAHYSHVMILWWAHQLDADGERETLRVHPRPAPDHLMGVFATRSPARPNPIAVSVCRLLGVDEDAGVLRLDGIDALDGTPVVDIKPYSPGLDRVPDPRQPAWFSHLRDEFEDISCANGDERDAAAGENA